MEVCQSVLFIWHLVCKLADLLVCDQGGGALLDSDLDQGAGEEANSPADEAWVVGGDLESNFWSEEVLTFKRLSDDGNWSQFLGGDFVEWDDIPPLMMAVAENQAGK